MNIESLSFLVIVFKYIIMIVGRICLIILFRLKMQILTIIIYKKIVFIIVLIIVIIIDTDMILKVRKKKYANF